MVQVNIPIGHELELATTIESGNITKQVLALGSPDAFVEFKFDSGTKLTPTLLRNAADAIQRAQEDTQDAT